MKQEQQNIFFALLRLALWQDNRDGELRTRDEKIIRCIVPEDDWKPVFTAATEHAVLGLLGPAMDYVPREQRPSYRQSDMHVLFTLKLNGCRNDMNSAIARVSELIEQTGARPILLKGEGLAALYPQGCHRAVGDIDIYVGEADFDKVCMAIDNANGIVPDPKAYRAECEHHYHTEYDGQELEIHHCIADLSWDNDAQRLNQWADHLLDTLTLRTMTIQGKQILLPPVQFDMFYIFQHLCKHILNEGGGLRQLIDWMVYLHHVHENHLPYDSNALLSALRDFDYLHSWQVLSGILHHQLGMPTDEIPFYDPHKAQKSQSSILQDILAGGNFGQYDRDDSAEQLSHGIKRTFLVLCSMWRNYRKKRLLFPRMAGTTFLQNFTIGAKNRIKAIRK